MPATLAETAQRRRSNRKKADARVIRIQFNDRMGHPKWLTADLIDVSETGARIALMTSLNVGGRITVRGKLDDNRPALENLATVKWCTEQINGNFHAGLEVIDEASAGAQGCGQGIPENASELDCYEIMQLSPNADAETVNRVYRILAQRFHPDTIETGNKEMFLKLCEAHDILSNSARRAAYDALYRETRQLHWKIFDRAEITKGPEAEHRKRQGILEMLYAKAVHDPEKATLTVFEFEQVLGCPREHLEAALWYLKGKSFVKRGDNGRFSITVQGFDEVEAHSLRAEHRANRLLEPVTQD
ncbi:MAG: DnaJ domain-containing protein [Acidobacteriota bacterium]